MKYTLTDPNGNVLLAVESSPVVTEADMKVDLDKAAKACESAFDEVTKYQDAMAVMSSEGFGEQVKIVASKVWEKIKEAIDRLIGWIKQLIKYIRDGVKSLFDKIKKFFASLVGKKTIRSVQDVKLETVKTEQSTETETEETTRQPQLVAQTIPSIEDIDEHEVLTIYYIDDSNNKTHVSVNLRKLVNVMKTSESFRNKTSFEFINPSNDFSTLLQAYQDVDTKLRNLFGEFKFGNSVDSVINSMNSVDEEKINDWQSIAATSIENIEKGLFVKAVNELDFAKAIKTLLDKAVINVDFGKVLKANDSFLSHITQHLMEYEAELELVQQKLAKTDENNTPTVKTNVLKLLRNQISLTSNAVNLFTTYSSSYTKIVACITTALDTNAEKLTHISEFTGNSKDFPSGVTPVYYGDRFSSGLRFYRKIRVGANHRELVKELMSSIHTVDASKNDILSEEYHKNCLKFIKTLCSLDSTILSVIGNKPEKSNACIIYHPGINITYTDGSEIIYSMEMVFDNRTIVDGITTVYSTSPISGLSILKGSIGQGFKATGGNFAMGINKNKVVPRIYFAKKPMTRSGRYLDDGILKSYLEQTLINSFESGYQVFDMSTKNFDANYLLALNVYECNVSNRVVYNDPEHPGALYVDDIDGKGLPCHNITAQWYKDNDILSSIPVDKRDAFKEYVKNNVKNLPKGCPILPVYYAI